MPSGHEDPTKLNPLSEHAWGELRRIVAAGADGVARHTVNPGVIRRLMREDLVRQEDPTGRLVATSSGIWKDRERRLKRQLS